MTHTLHPFYTSDEDKTPLLTIARDDGYNWVIGEEDVDDLIRVLTRYRDSKEHDGFVEWDDPRTLHHVEDIDRRWRTIPDIARMFDIHRQTVWDAVEKGWIPHRESRGKKWVNIGDARKRWGKKAEDQEDS